ncbi:MAG TPA: hypothetical protein VNF29_15490, partial [Candidatus Binataceae bacterium]|nr:hypothetical protein [Candidatus Binataceae bacterium]
MIITLAALAASFRDRRRATFLIFYDRISASNKIERMAQQQAATAAPEPTSRFVEVEGIKLHYLD